MEEILHLQRGERVSCSDIDATCYIPQPDNSNFKLSRIISCPSPLPIASGSHKIIFDLNYNDERFVIAVEERENFDCTFDGENIIVGTATPAGRKLAENKSFVVDLVKMAIFMTTGMMPVLEETRLVPMFGARPGADNYRQIERFQTTVTSVDAVLKAGCSLSSNSKGCMAFFFEGAMSYFSDLPSLQSPLYVFTGAYRGYK